MVKLSASLLGALTFVASWTQAALTANLDDTESIKAAAALVAKDLLSFYPIDTPGWTVGILPGPPPAGDYYWWEAGAMWGTLLDYRQYTGDKSHDELITNALLAQVGRDHDFMPANWSASMGNDDQAFWGLSAMLAAETGYTNPPSDQPQWLALVQAVFNEQTHVDRRVTSGNCDGGLRWQVYPSNNGYDYINTIANACYFNLGARLARYTDNDTYAELANETWNFVTRVGYVDAEWNVYDGAHLPDCASINKAQFSYNAALLIQGCAFLYNYTNGAQIWANRLDGLITRSLTLFFPNGTAYEPSCEPVSGQCNTDMKSFKGYMARWLASTTVLAPFTKDTVMPVLKSSAQAAVRQCTGGDNGRMCGFHWSSGVFDGEMGAGQQMNVLAALTSLLVEEGSSNGPLTNSTGGTSVGDPNAGSGDVVETEFRKLTGGDRAGAGILTVLLAGAAVGMFAWMSIDLD